MDSLDRSSDAVLSTSYKPLSNALADRYRIERQLGQGGMATVYLAHDLKHDRKVALKVLKPELAAVLGAERFVVEIKTTAALQHPHILPLFDSGTTDGFLYYVMPFIDGETLRSKLNRETQLSVDEALRITTQIADALDYAHRNGVIHRDIKPENILLHDGRPMVADFGIALAVSAAAGGRMTETGLSLGTPHYMSPEQATAEKDITARSDVYSLASVLYEMLAGVPPHSGGSAQQIIMRIITDTPRPVTELRKSVSPNVAAALAKALEKVPADRFSSAKAFADALGTSGFVYTGQTRSQGYVAQPATRATSMRRTMSAAVAGVALLVAGIAAGVALPRRGAEAPRVVRFPFMLPPSQRLSPTIVDDASFALSPDGRTIAAAVADSTGVFRLHVQSLEQLVSTPFPGTEGASAPFFSFDGKWIGFHTRPGLALKKVPITGGAVTTLVESTSTRQSASWGDDGTIVFVNARRQLSRVRGAGGPTESFVRGDSNQTFLWPAMLPGSKHVLAERCDVTGCRQHDLVAVELATGTVTVVVPNATRGWYAPSGHVLYGTTDRAVYAVKFNPRTLAVSGEPIPMLESVESTALYGTRVSIATLNGAMMYQPTGGGGQARVVAMDRTGRERAVIAQPGEYSNPRWSPDRTHIAVQLRGSSGSSQIWVYDIASETFTQLTRDGDNIRPTWSPDSKRLAFSGASLMWMPADGSTPPERVLESVSDQGLAPNWTHDGKYITLDGFLRSGVVGEDVFAVAVTGKHELESVVATPGNDQTGAVSPDGKWIAYTSDESEGNKVYVRPFRAPGGRYLISTGAGTQPLWASNSELIYVDNQALSLMSAALELGATVKVTGRKRLFDLGPYLRGSASWWDYDVSRDGREFLFVRPDRVSATVNPIVVLNWTEEIKRRTIEQGGRN
jgi:eukaryotic-like serine/threonine-protein kinase